MGTGDRHGVPQSPTEPARRRHAKAMPPGTALGMLLPPLGGWPLELARKPPCCWAPSGAARAESRPVLLRGPFHALMAEPACRAGRFAGSRRSVHTRGGEGQVWTQSSTWASGPHCWNSRQQSLLFPPGLSPPCRTVAHAPCMLPCRLCPFHRQAVSPKVQ